MISWTETTNFTALTSQYSSSSSGATQGDERGIETPGFSDRLVKKNASQSASLTQSADSNGVTYKTQINYYTVSASTDNVEGTTASFGITDNLTQHDTIQPNGASTRIQSSYYYTTANAEALSLELNSSLEVNTTETFYAGSTQTTRASQTTTYTSFATTRSVSATTSASTTTATVSSSQASTRTTTTSFNTTTTQAGTTSKSQTTTQESTFTEYGGSAGSSYRTNYLAENEVLWMLTDSSQAIKPLQSIATSHTSTFSLIPLTTITTAPVSTFANSSTGFYSTQSVAETKQSTVLTQTQNVITVAWDSNIGRLPLSTRTVGSLFTHGTQTSQTETSSVSFVFGTSTTAATIVAKTMTGKSANQTFQFEYATTGTTSIWTDGMTVPQSASSSGTYENDVGFGDAVSTSSASSESATLQGAMISFGMVGVGGQNTAKAVETVYTYGWAIPSAPASPFSSVGLSPQITWTYFLKTIDGTAAPQQRHIQLFFPTTSSHADSNGSSTISVGANGVSRTSIGTASTAEAQTTSGSWSGSGDAITRQVDGVADWQSPSISFAQIASFTKIGGKPMVGSSIEAYMPPGLYVTASGETSGTTRRTTTYSTIGTAQTAFAAVPEFLPLQGGELTYSTPRNPLLYNSSFFPI